MVATAYASIPAPSAPLSIPRKALSAALALLVKATDRRSSIPVLADFALTTCDGRQKISATNLNVTVSYTAPAGGAPVHGVTVNAKLLADMVKSATGDTITLTKSGSGVTVGSNGSDATLLGRPGQDFPKVRALPDDMPAIDGPAIADALDACAHAVCKDETRFHLNGVYIIGNRDSHRIIATDGHRLIKILRYCDTFAGTGILPAPSAAIVAKIARLGTVRGVIAGHMLHVGCVTPDGGFWECSFKLIDAQYPPHEQVIPTDYTKLATIERKPLIAAMKRAKALCTQTRGAKLTVASGKLTIMTEHPDSGTISESLKAESEWIDSGGGVVVGVSAGYLIEALEEISCKHVTIAFGGELDPIEVRGTDDQVEYAVANARQIEVIMPMRI